MNKKIVIISVLLCVFGYSFYYINKDIRNSKYEKLGSIEVSLENNNNKIEPSGYKYGFDFNYNALPVLQLEDSEGNLVFEFADNNVKEIIVGEDYYANSTIYKETYILSKTSQGKFELPIKRNNNIQGYQAIYYVKYDTKDDGVFVFKAEF